jgi:hypothetical protein
VGFDPELSAFGTVLDAEGVSFLEGGGESGSPEDDCTF